LIARSILEQTDLPQPLVRIEAVIVEVNSDYIKNLGLTWDVSGTNFTYNHPAGGGGLITGAANATVSLQALITHNRARVLASPNISVVDNEDASIFIGELRRFLGGTVVTPAVGTVQSVESLPVGIALLIRPRIHPNGDVTLKVHPVISAVTSTIQGLPQTSSREADTTIRLKEGEEMVIGGLDQVEVTRNLVKLPILGDIPVIGELFRSRTHSKRKTTVVVIIRASPVLTELAPTRDFKKGIIK
jgi:type II secretory pathway component GspD/PulD (secretin)